ncbi:hypothetical protein [Streptomyces tendae]
MRARAIVVTATAALASVLVGCSSSGEPDEIRVTVTETVTPGSETATADPTQQADSKSSGTSPMRTVQKFSLEGDDEYDPMAGTVTVLSYQQPVPSHVSAAEEFDAKGFVWAALEVKVCATEGEFTTSSLPWTLSYDDGARIEPSSSTYDDFPKPEYVEDAPVVAGDCSRGKIVFPVPGNKRPAKALYSTDDSPTLRWSLS